MLSITYVLRIRLEKHQGITVNGFEIEKFDVQEDSKVKKDPLMSLLPAVMVEITS